MLHEGDEISADGDFTIYRFVKGLSHNQLESKVGMQPGRLSPGIAVAVMAPASIASLSNSDFILGASTRWSRSSAAAPWARFSAIRLNGTMQPNAIETKLTLDGHDPQALKDKYIAFFLTGGGNRPAKIFPAWLHENGMRYPDAIGIGLPQFKLLNRRTWIVVKVSASQRGGAPAIGAKA